MMLQKVVVTKMKERVYVIQFNEQEFEDMRSAMTTAAPLVSKMHKDSPSFRRAVHKIDRNLKTIHKAAINNLKQRGLW